jgi:hypothetical protein
MEGMKTQQEHKQIQTEKNLNTTKVRKEFLEKENKRNKRKNERREK